MFKTKPAKPAPFLASRQPKMTVCANEKQGLGLGLWELGVSLGSPDLRQETGFEVEG